jgi:hypothetical protein
MIVGRKFGMLMVVSTYRTVRDMACCVCACGNEHHVRVNDLESRGRAAICGVPGTGIPTR